MEKFATIKDRIDADKALANNAYGNQNIFFPSVRARSMTASEGAWLALCSASAGASHVLVSVTMLSFCWDHAKAVMGRSITRSHPFRNRGMQHIGLAVVICNSTCPQRWASATAWQRTGAGPS